MSRVQSKIIGAGRLAVLALAAWAIAAPIQAQASDVPPWLVCADSRESTELSMSHLPLPQPTDGSTVSVGTPVTFSGESSHPLTFNIASSPSLLSAPDVDSGLGALQSGALYTFTSSKASAVTRTVYWSASITFTPDDCEAPVTFTTPARTLTIVLPASAEAEAAAKRKQEEEAAAQQKHAEEAAALAKSREEQAAVADGVSLESAMIDVAPDHRAAVKLRCTGTTMCSGVLVLTMRVTAGEGNKQHSHTSTVGPVKFSIGAGTAATVYVTIPRAGVTELDARGHLNASVAIHEVAPASGKTQTLQVHLERHRREDGASGTREGARTLPRSAARSVRR
jgi:hypothetical protein